MLCAACFISLFYGEETATVKLVFKFIRRIIYTVGFICGTSIAMPLLKRHRKAVFYALLPCAAAGAAISLYLFYTTPHMARAPYHFQDLHPNAAAWMYGMLGVGIMGCLRKQSTLSDRIWAFLALALLFSAIMMTSSRSGILGIASALPVFIATTRDKRILPVLLAAGVALAVYLFSGHDMQHSDKGRLISIEKLVSRKDSGRLTFWKELIGRMDGKEYLIGRGFFADHTTAQLDPEIWFTPHSLYLSSFYHGGAITLFLHLSLYIATVWIGFGNIKSGSNSLMLFAAFAFIPSLVDGKSIIDLSIKFPPAVLLFWIPVAMAAGSEYLRCAGSDAHASRSGKPTGHIV
jgi:hypothetical protein